MSSTRFAKLTVKELKTILSEDGATNISKLTKQELIARLLRREENPDRNLTLFEVNAVEPETGHDFPSTNFLPISSFKQEQFQFFGEVFITDWFEKRRAGSSMKAGRTLAIRKFIKCIEVNVLKDENNDALAICVKALCAAAASKNVDYVVKVILDNEGKHIGQGNCLCPAGAGWSAACKHVAALTFNLEHYGLCGETMELVSKTSKPQEWGKPSQAGRQVGVLKADEIAGVEEVPRPIKPERLETLKNLLKQFEPSSPLLCKPSWTKGVSQSSSLEERTRMQSNSQEWRAVRRKMITASIVHDVLRTVETGNFGKGPALRQMNPTDLSKVPAVKWGIKHEKQAIKAYEKVMGVKATPCGLFQHKEWDYLGATPDAISSDRKTVIEIKCPYSVRNEPPHKCSYLDVKNRLVNKKYYAQVQTQMLLTDIHRCDFVIWTKNGVIIQSLKFNKAFSDRLLSAVNIYYQTVFLPLLESTNKDD